MKRPHFILNPTSSAGKTGRNQGWLLRLLERAFPRGFTLDVTTRAGDATKMTRRALEEGSDLVVAVGGDGTMHEIINGFFSKGRRKRKSARMGFLCSGTAQDVARNLGLPASLEDQLTLLTSPASRSIDLGRIRWRSKEGEIIEHLFINDCQPGIAARVVPRVTPNLKRLGGFMAFGIASTFTVMTYRAQFMRVVLDKKKERKGRFLGVVVANGRYAGGGMDFAPRSSTNDGLLDVILIKDQPVLARLMNFPRIYSGGHVNLPWIEYHQVKHVRIESNERVPFEADGELLGFLPCDIEVVPGALPVCGGRIRRRNRT